MQFSKHFIYQNPMGSSKYSLNKCEMNLCGFFEWFQSLNSPLDADFGENILRRSPVVTSWLLIRSWSHFGGPAIHAKVHQCVIFPPFVESGSHCGRVANDYIILSWLIYSVPRLFLNFFRLHDVFFFFFRSLVYFILSVRFYYKISWNQSCVYVVKYNQHLWYNKVG